MKPPETHKPNKKREKEKADLADLLAFEAEDDEAELARIRAEKMARKERELAVASAASKTATVAPIESCESVTHVTSSDPTEIHDDGMPLDSRELGVSSPLGKGALGVSQALGSRELGVSSTLGKKRSKKASALGQALGSRELGVRQIEISALDAETLVGDERALVVFIGIECRRLGSLETNWINSEDLKKLLNLSSNELRNLIFRVKGKGFFSLNTHQSGRVGLRKFKLSQIIYQQVSALDRREIGVSSPLGQALGQALDGVPSSSRNFLIRESTSTQPDTDFSSIDLRRVQQFGITTSVLARCVELYPLLKLEQLEGLVCRFAEFARDPKNKVQNARGFFISLAEQASKGQVPLDHIETPDDRLMRLFVEKQKETKARHAEFERAAQEFECETWLETLTPGMKLTLVPETSILKVGSAPHMAMLKNYFAENVWPERRQQILQDSASL